MRTTMGWIARGVVSVPFAWNGAHLFAPAGSLDIVVLALFGTAINMLTLWTLQGLVTGRLR